MILLLQLVIIVQVPFLRTIVETSEEHRTSEGVALSLCRENLNGTKRRAVVCMVKPEVSEYIRGAAHAGRFGEKNGNPD